MSSLEDVNPIEVFLDEATAVLAVLAEWASEFDEFGLDTPQLLETQAERETAVWQVVEITHDLISAMLEAQYAQVQAAQAQSRLVLPSPQDRLPKLSR